MVCANLRSQRSDSERLKECDERRLGGIGRLVEPTSHQLSFSGVAPNRILDGGGGAVMQKRPAAPKSPQRRCPDLFRSAGRLPNAVAGTDIVQQ